MLGDFAIDFDRTTVHTVHTVRLCCSWACVFFPSSNNLTPSTSWRYTQPIWAKTRNGGDKSKYMLLDQRERHIDNLQRQSYGMRRATVSEAVVVVVVVVYFDRSIQFLRRWLFFFI